MRFVYFLLSSAIMQRTVARTLLLFWARHEKTATDTLSKTAISTVTYTESILCSMFKPSVHLYQIKLSNMEVKTVAVLTQISCAPVGVLLELLSTKIRCVAVRYRVPFMDLLLKRSRSRTCSTCKWAQSQHSGKIRSALENIKCRTESSWHMI